MTTIAQSLRTGPTRHLTLRHARRNALAKSKLRASADGDDGRTDEDLPPLGPGEERLYSFYAPSLKAGPVQTISVKQIVKATESEPGLELSGTKDFYVDAPQFSLPDGSVHSVYPPPGYSESHRIVPHAVLSDPHLPWERFGDHNPSENTGTRNRTPWIAILSFTQDEIRLSPEDLDPASGIFSNTSQKAYKQSSTYSVNMTIDDLWKTKDITTPITTTLISADKAPKTSSDIVFVGKELFTNLFSPFDESNVRKDVGAPDVSLYQYQAHVRNINTEGMAMAGVEDDGHFGIVVGNRSGPVDNETSVPVTVHLVSLEGISQMKFPITQSHVALCSLHSWNYTVQPAGMLEVYDAFVNLGKSIDVLRPPSRILDSITPANDAQQVLKRRLQDGYSLVRYRTTTGEATVGFQRGPFTPTETPPMAFSKCSNSGLDLQILDSEVGIMDLTYSAAWQLGRTLAIADQVFTGALMRFRTAIHTMATDATKKEVLQKRNAIRTREAVLSTLSKTIEHLEAVHLTCTDDAVESEQSGPFSVASVQKRWRRPKLHKSQIADLSFNSDDTSDIYLKNAIAVALKLAMAVSDDPDEIYDETNTPVSTDWMVVLGWLMDRLSLGGVPAHYYISDPTHLEHERLRFFYIDENWTDALVDGALSLGNHMGNDKDRVAIKEALNRYIKTQPRKQQHTPQIPKYGFLLRSDLVTRFPDLKVSTTPEADPRAPILRHEIVADGVMLCLFDRVPGSSLLQELQFTQPAHQQCFSVGQHLDTEKLEIVYRRQYTVDEATREQIEGPDGRSKPLLKDPVDVSPTTQDNLFIWGSKPASSALSDLRILRFPRFAHELLRLLQENMPSTLFEDDTTTSALVALQLNDPIFKLRIGLDPDIMGTRDAKRLGSNAVDPFEPRIMKSTIPSTVARIFPDEVRVSVSSEAEPESAARAYPAAAPAPFERVPMESHYASLAAPHIRPIPTEVVPETSSRSRATRPGDVPASLPQYDVRCYSMESRNNRVYTGDGLPQDLIFSIRVDRSDTSTYELREFSITFQLGPPPKPGDRHQKYYLMQSYDGPGAGMLSNLRFNPLVTLRSHGGIDSLMIRLVPRSTTGFVKITSVKEMSFRLSLGLVNEFEDPSVSVNMTYNVKYNDDKPIPPAEFQAYVRRTKTPPAST